MKSGKDFDPIETREWIESLDDVIDDQGTDRASFLLNELAKHLMDKGAVPSYNLTTPFKNTIAPENEAMMPGDLFMERRIRSLIRWKALVTVLRANKNEDELGGHIATFSSAAMLYDIGFNYVFRGQDSKDEDLIYFQGHCSPGIYARSFLEGRLDEEDLDNFRREVESPGLSSYPHPWLMSDYWQFPLANPLLLWSIVIFSVILVAFGLPIFILLASLAISFFLSEPSDWATNYDLISTISDSAYRIVVSPTLAAIPIFTLAGYILAESNISDRLIKFFKANLGWLPGSTVLIVVILCAFFTALTGGSGVTILALGAILYPILVHDGYSKRFSLGIITTAGSLGLLFPPSLPAIIYSLTAGINPLELFKQALIPAIFLLSIMFFYGLYMLPQNKKIEKFNAKNALNSAKIAQWELVIPILIILSLFSGFATLVESAALLVLYVLTIELYIFKDIVFKDLPKIIIDCSTLVGGVLIILGFAMGFTGYLVDAQIPLKILNFVQSTISSKIIFLLALNILLLVIGCLMDVFSAIIVVVPLIAPLATYFGIDPFHLAIIFIANLELGYITPPVGMNLYLSSYRFEKDMPTIYAATLPFFFIRLIGVIFITYIPLFFY